MFFPKVRTDFEKRMAAGSDSCGAQGLLARGLALQKELRSWEGPGSARLLKLARGELAFVNRLAGLPVLPPSCPELRSSNFDHLEAVFRVLQNPLINGVSAVMQSFPVTSSEDSGDERVMAAAAAATKEEPGGGPVAHVDVVCILQGKPIWLVISTRNPRYIVWSDSDKHVKGLRSRLLLLLSAACADAAIQPASILLCFGGDVDDEVDRGLKHEFGAVCGLALGDGGRAAQFPSSSSSFLESSMVVLGPKDVFHHQEEDCNFSEVEGGEWLDVEVHQEATARADITAAPPWVTYDVDVARFREVLERCREVRKTECSELITAVDDDATTIVRGEAEKEEDCFSTKDEDDDNKLANGSRETVPPAVNRSAEGSESDECCHSSRSIHGDVDAVDDKALLHSVGIDRGLVNLDTTVLVALVSEVSNGGAERLLSLPGEDMVRRFSNMTTFIREQALSELARPLVKEIEGMVGGRRPVVAQYAHNEFNSIVTLVGGPKEQERARKLLQRVRVVPDTPSERVMALPLTGKIKTRHKIVFGTGDELKVPTLTANMAFVRAARQKGMAIEVVEHRPRALTGD